MSRLGWFFGLLALSTTVAGWSPLVRAADPVSEYISKPAQYQFQETIRLVNHATTPALNVVARVILLPPKTAYSQVQLTAVRPEPNRLVQDNNQNTIGIYHFPRIGGGQTRTITVRLTAVSHAIAYRLPETVAPYDTHSALYRQYTNPRFEYREGVNTDAPALRILVRRATQGLTSPVARAKALFTWEVNHIQYRPGSHAAGSALATLRLHSGICSDFAELYAALLRTDHIPARLISGYVTNNGGGQAGFHEWDEFYLPQIGWVVADPTWGHFGYFARLEDNWHVPLYGGTVPDVSVHYASRVKSGTLRVFTRYQFTTESMTPTPAPHQPLPVLSVALPHNTARAHRLPASGLARWWQSLIHAVARFFHFLTHWW